MFGRTSSIGKDPKLLLDLNRSHLKKVFSKLHPSKDGRISFVDVTKFCRVARLYPDLVSTQDLKSLIEKIRPNYPTSSITLSYLQFEQLIGRIAALLRAVPRESRVQTILEHIQFHCGTNYAINFKYSGSRESPVPSFRCEDSTSPHPKLIYKERRYADSPRIQRTSTATSYLSDPKGNSTFDDQISPRNKPMDGTPNSARVSLRGLRTALHSMEPRTRPSAINPSLRRPNFTGNLSPRYIRSPGFSNSVRSDRNRSQSKEMDSNLFSDIIKSPGSTPTNPFLKNMTEITQVFGAFKLNHEIAVSGVESLKEKPLRTRLRHYQDFISHLRSSSFSLDFVKRLVFVAWKTSAKDTGC